MSEMEQKIMRELAQLPPTRHADVLAFIRFLRFSLMDDQELERQFDAAIAKIRETAQRYNITEQDIEEEIRAVRQAHARGA